MPEFLKGPVALAELGLWIVREKALQALGKVGIAQEVDFGDYPRVEITNVEAPVATEEELNG